MNWAHLPSPACYEFFPDGLAKEAKRLARDVAAVEKKRAKADDLAAAVVDMTSDRTGSLRATIDALEAELQVRDQLVVFSLATERAAADLQHRVEAKIRAVAEKRRAELGIPDEADVPVAVLQNTAAWWAARRELAACNISDGSGQRRDHQHEIGRIEARLVELKTALAGEADRRARVIESRRAEESFVPASQVEHEARMDAVRGLESRAAQLLK